MKVKVKMSEFFLELFSEEIPAKLQVNARKNLYDNFKNFFDENEVEIKGQIKVFSTPNRLVVYIEKIANSINKKSEEIRGPSTKAPDQAIEGFIRSNNLNKEDVYRKKIEKGEFYFSEIKAKTIDISKELQKIIPEAKITVAHGQMPENHLSEVMNQFYNKEFDIFLIGNLGPEYIKNILK